MLAKNNCKMNGTSRVKGKRSCFNCVDQGSYKSPDPERFQGLKLYRLGPDSFFSEGYLGPKALISWSLVPWGENPSSLMKVLFIESTKVPNRNIPWTTQTAYFLELCLELYLGSILHFRADPLIEAIKR